MFCCSSGSPARIFACLACGHEHVAAEAGRLLTRVWAPRAARRGGPTWTLTKADRPQEEDGGQLSSVEDPVTSKQAKSICLGPTGRYREDFISVFAGLPVQVLRFELAKQVCYMTSNVCMSGLLHKGALCKVAPSTSLHVSEGRVCTPLDWLKKHFLGQHYWCHVALLREWLVHKNFLTIFWALCSGCCS